MARTVEDVALILTAIAGPDRRSPIAMTEPADIFACPLERDFRGVQVAWSCDFGQLPVDPLVTDILAAGRPTFESLGCEIIDETPDFSDADEIFKTWRAWRFELNFHDLFETHREAIKETIIWNIQEGKKLTGPQLARAELKRTQLYHRVRQFMERCEFMIFPVSQVPPFSVQDRYVAEINGEKMQTYIDWMKSCYFISVTGLPAISVPCGFTPDGRPVGVQIVGRHHDDFGVLQLAFAFQQATEFWKERPEHYTLTRGLACRTESGTSKVYAMGVSRLFPVDERYQVPDQERTVGDAGRQFLSLWKKQPRCGKSNHCGPREALLSLC